MVIPKTFLPSSLLFLVMPPNVMVRPCCWRHPASLSHRTCRNQAGPHREASSLLANFHSAKKCSACHRGRNVPTTVPQLWASRATVMAFLAVPFISWFKIFYFASGTLPLSDSTSCKVSKSRSQSSSFMPVHICLRCSDIDSAKQRRGAAS